MKRRTFLQTGMAATVGTALAVDRAAAAPSGGPIIVSTWSHGVPANRAAQATFDAGGSVLDAVEAGVRVPEADPEVTSVGYGGWPNSEGVVQLDAAIMRGRDLEAGSVAGLEGILHPITVARRVMENTRHVLLVGAGAQAFALRQGMKTRDLLSPAAKQRWEEWAADPDRTVPGHVEDHDTIGLVARDSDGKMAAACTTSGLAWKIPGRVGDSPLVGHGLYCDDAAGAASATGIGEEVIKVCGSYQVVEFMRQGVDPDEAVRRVLNRMIRRDPKNQERMMAFVALRADGAIGFGCTTPGFQAAVTRNGRHELLDAWHLAGG